MDHPGDKRVNRDVAEAAPALANRHVSNRAGNGDRRSGCPMGRQLDSSEHPALRVPGVPPQI